MSLESIAKKIAAETGCDLLMASKMAEQLTKVHEDLHPVVSAWLKDDLIDFEFKGVSLDMIIKKEHTPYIKAILSMNALLNNPRFADMYLKMKFATDDMEG